ncbi:MAG TPA: efflux transporter outer membrane subunit [Burkholderiaceae bacterium]
MLVSALALSGCVSLAPKYERPVAPVAAAWPLPAPAAKAAPALAWQRYFAGDPRLLALIDIGLKNNRDLRAAAFNAEQAGALARVADANRWPALNAAFISSRYPGGAGTPSSYVAGLQVNAYELDLFGKLKSNDDAATARYLASVEGQRAAHVTLVAGIVAADLALRADEESLVIARDTLAGRENSLKLMQRKFDLGAASGLDLRSAESAAASARVALAQATRQREQDGNALVLLLGQGVPTDLPPAHSLDGLTLAAVPAGLPSEVLVARPDVRQAEQQLIAANANIGAARAAYFPSIALTASAGTASSALSDLFKHSAWSFVTQAVMPIFDWGRTSANVASAKAAAGVAQAQYEKSIQSAFREVADALAGQATLADQLQAQCQQEAAERARYQLVELRFNNGASSALEQLDAQRSLFAAQQALVQTRLAQALNQVQLYKALGGG